MSRLYGPIDREVQVVEMRQSRMLEQLETKRLINQSISENGWSASFSDVSGFERIVIPVVRAVQGRIARYRLSPKTEMEATC